MTHANAGGYYNPKTGNYEMPPPKTTTEKNIPSDFFGEWCYVGDNGNGGINYRLPSWSEPGLCDKKDKLLNISGQTFGADEIYCDLTSKVKVTEECAPSGCGTTAKFTASCYPGSNPNAKSTFKIEIGRYKGNLDIQRTPLSQERKGAAEGCYSMKYRRTHPSCKITDPIMENGSCQEDRDDKC